jgi:hypothetical protein
MTTIQKLKAAAIVTLMSIVVVAHHNVRFVNAEDDCAYSTYNVQRLPLVGLACIGE